MLSLASCVGRVVVLLVAVWVTTSLTLSGEWGEEGVTYSQLGKDVTLSCAGVRLGAAVDWWWNGARMLPEDSVVQQGQLLLPQAKLSSEGTYSCHDADGLLLSAIILRLGRVPEVPSISCRASNYENFSCFWAPSVETFLPTMYISTYSVHGLECEFPLLAMQGSGFQGRRLLPFLSRLSGQLEKHSKALACPGSLACANYGECCWGQYRVLLLGARRSCAPGSRKKIIEGTSYCSRKKPLTEDERQRSAPPPRLVCSCANRGCAACCGGRGGNRTTCRRSQPSDVGLCAQDPARPLSCTVSKAQFWSSYRMNVTELNPLGSSFRLLDVTMQAILKPDPPEGLRVEPVPAAPRQLRVSWEYPSTWPQKLHFQLKFRLQYRPVVSRSWSVVETANLSEVITDAFIGLEHVVQVSAKDFLDAGSWSEWSLEASGLPAPGQAMAPSEVATAAGEPESPAEEPSLAPNNEPVAGRSDSMEQVAVLVSLGVFAFFILAVILVFAFLMWARVKKPGKEATKHHDLLAAAIHLKALPKAQIL